MLDQHQPQLSLQMLNDNTQPTHNEHLIGCHFETSPTKHVFHNHTKMKAGQNLRWEGQLLFHGGIVSHPQVNPWQHQKKPEQPWNASCILCAFQIQNPHLSLEQSHTKSTYYKKTRSSCPHHLKTMQKTHKIKLADPLVMFSAASFLFITQIKERSQLPKKEEEESKKKVKTKENKKN